MKQLIAPMKMNKLHILLFTIAVLSILGCKSEKKARITYGTLVDTEATDLQYGALAAKVAKNENFCGGTGDSPEGIRN